MDVTSPIGKAEDVLILGLQTQLQTGLSILDYGELWMYAIRYEHYRLVSFFLEHKFPIDKQVSIGFGNTTTTAAIHEACNERNIRMVAFLLDHGADIHLCDSLGLTPLMYAISPHVIYVGESGWVDDSGSLPLIRYLVERGVNVNQQSSGLDADHPCTNIPNITALHIACQHKQVKVVQFLVECGANIHAVNAKNLNALHYACTYYRMINSKDMALLKYLLDQGVDVHERSVYGYTPFDYAMICEDVNTVPFLLTYAPSPRNISESAPLFLRVYKRNYRSLMILFWMAVGKRNPKSTLHVLPTDLLRLLQSHLCIPKDSSFV